MTEKIIKQSIYPKTTRFGLKKGTVQITEKIDGSNLTIFKHNNELYIAQRNNIFKYNDFENYKNDFKGIIYKGLEHFLEKYAEDLKDKLYEGSAICGEWIAMGQIKYANRFSNKFLLFAKARVQEENGRFTLSNIVYNLDLIHWALGENLPFYIGLVPFVKEFNHYPTLDELDNLYKEYTEDFEKKVEGFVISFNENIVKYVRLKRGEYQPHIIK